MADLSEKDSASTTKLVGADSDGVETYFAGVNPDGSLPTSSSPSTPPFADPIIRTGISNVGISSPGDDLYTITNGKTLKVQQLSGGAQDGTDGSKISLFEDPNGDLSVLHLFAVLYVNQSSWQIDLQNEFVGNGVRRVLMRRYAFSASTREIFGRWIGYES